ncbi:hypothetical protein TIFTF001_023279 [Ficus carica]|uniref:Uncharacterized protein n=1 Tax=Ficus carica TaxID=3494 RepID=A0AA88AED5_FICCA|nr:hypothetical protein TIFTF001_023279 [Ficus carica]
MAEVHPAKKLHPKVVVEKLTVPVSSVCTVQSSINASVASVSVIFDPEGTEATPSAEWVDSTFKCFLDSSIPANSSEIPIPLCEQILLENLAMEHKVSNLEAQVSSLQGSQSEITKLKNEMVVQDNQINEKSLKLEKF